MDSGSSFTHAVPMFDGHVIDHAVRRIDVGGKLLTNHLKEVVSYRAWNMMDETHVINAIKERLSYVAMDPVAELKRCEAQLHMAPQVRDDDDDGDDDDDDDDDGVVAT